MFVFQCERAGPRGFGCERLYKHEVAYAIEISGPFIGLAASADAARLGRSDGEGARKILLKTPSPVARGVSK